jgi:putative ABC transport system ATP-binding protein
VVFQGFHLVPTMTALENVALPLELAGGNGSHDAAREALRAVGLETREHHYPSQLSGGEQQRVAIARGFVGRPSLLLADEPTGNLDESTSRMVMDLIFSMQAEIGAGMILITHDPGLAARCGRGLEMHGGRLTDPAREMSSR